MQANLAALHRMRNQFMSVVQLHQEASLSITPRADARAKAALVVVGYNAETGDWLCRYDDNDEEYLRDEELYKLGVEPVKKNGSEECVRAISALEGNENVGSPNL